MAIVPLDTALKFLERNARKMLPSGYKLDYTGDSRFLRKEGNKFLPAFLLAVVLIFLVLAAHSTAFATRSSSFSAQCRWRFSAH